jgi:hypothetical protein
MEIIIKKIQNSFVSGIEGSSTTVTWLPHVYSEGGTRLFSFIKGQPWKILSSLSKKVFYLGSYQKRTKSNRLKVHKIEIFFGFDFEICIISILVMSKY